MAIIDAGDDMVYAKRGCCFWMSSSSSSSSSGLGWWERMRAPENKERWWVKGWKKIREWSEILAGPKWKTFIRRFNKNRSIGYTKKGSFQYDPLSYTLNFDDGMGSKRDEDYGYVDFSSRYASVPVSAKSSMDLGKDGPSFI
ncbi:hypothetical protein SESBI_06457 [Sesbania bispinosa]|nr:hypothetical protein SESBI_06457 [Sesbania bispinosa]